MRRCAGLSACRWNRSRPRRAAVAGNSSTTLNCAWTTGTITSCASRSIGCKVKATSLRFQALTISWPW